MKIDKKDEHYVTECLATVNRNWIAAHLNAMHEARESGYWKGKGEGYQEGIKENKIIMPL